MVKFDLLTLMAAYLTCCALVVPGKQHLDVQVGCQIPTQGFKSLRGC